MITQQRLLKSLRAPGDRLRMRRECTSRLSELVESQYWSADHLHSVRWNKLRSLLEHAFEHTQFYRERFREAGVSPRDIHDLDDLRKLPPLTKDDLRGHLTELIASNLGPESLQRSATGGSTGEHTPFYRDNACVGRKLAVEHRFNRWTGWTPGRRIAWVWPALQDFAPSTWSVNPLRWLPSSRLMLNAGRLDEAALADQVERLNRFRPELIRAFPNPLSVLSNYIKQTGGLNIRPKGIITVGEPLMDGHRTLFQEVFGCPVFNVYVSRESGNMAGECEAHAGLHIAAESLIIEFEREGRPVSPGEPGLILVTDLENYGMPFLRYRIEDMGIPRPGLCSCGRGLPLMEMAAGRVSDFLISPHDGAVISGASLCHHLIAEGPEVGQVQLVQDAPDHLTIRILRGGRYQQPDLAHFGDVLGRIFRGAMQFDFAFVDEIPRDPSGKYRFSINQIPAASGSVGHPPQQNCMLRSPLAEPQSGAIL